MKTNCRFNCSSASDKDLMLEEHGLVNTLHNLVRQGNSKDVAKVRISLVIVRNEIDNRKQENAK